MPESLWPLVQRVESARTALLQEVSEPSGRRRSRLRFPDSRINIRQGRAAKPGAFGWLHTRLTIHAEVPAMRGLRNLSPWTCSLVLAAFAAPAAAQGADPAPANRIMVAAPIALASLATAPAARDTSMGGRKLTTGRLVLFAGLGFLGGAAVGAAYGAADHPGLPHKGGDVPPVAEYLVEFAIVGAVAGGIIAAATAPRERRATVAPFLRAAAPNSSRERTHWGWGAQVSIRF